MSSRRERSFGVYLGDLDRRRTDSQGIISYALALTRALAPALAVDERLVVFCSTAVRSELGDIEGLGPVEIVDVAPPTNARTQLWHEQVGVARIVDRAGVDVVHFPKGRAPLRWRAAPKIVATIHDDIPFQYRSGSFGERSRGAKSAYVVASLRRTLETADLVLTDSQFSRRQLERVTNDHSPIRVIVPGLTIEPAGSRAARRRGSHLLVFDSPCAHKRADEAAAFAARYVMERKHANHQVLLLGSGRGAAVGELFPDLVAYEPGPVTNERVETLVRTSRAVVVASRYEGLGLPALEAWALGTPAVVADSEAAREMLWNVPGLYRGGDFAGFEHALDRVLASEQDDYDDWSKIVTERCDWERAAAEVLDAYRELAR